MVVIFGLSVVLAAMVLVGFAFAAPTMPGLDGDTVVIAGATLFGALVGGLITFAIERWRLAEDRRERRATARMLVGDALVDFERNLVDLWPVIGWGIDDPSGFKIEMVKPPPFPLNDHRTWIAERPGDLPQRVYALKREIRKYQDASHAKHADSLTEGRPPDGENIQPSFANLFATVDDVRRDVVAPLDWPANVVDADTEHALRKWAACAKRGRRE